MCLVTQQQKPRITTEDMIVWKILTKSLMSVFFDFTWERGELYRTEIVILDPSCSFEYYNGTAYDYYEECDKVTLIQIAQGFHAFTDEEVVDAEISGLNRRVKAKCLIPAGSEVFEDATGLIVSNQMMLL